MPANESGHLLFCYRKNPQAKIIFYFKEASNKNQQKGNQHE
jgi:hypothetical protein